MLSLIASLALTATPLISSGISSGETDASTPIVRYHTESIDGLEIFFINT